MPDLSSASTSSDRLRCFSRGGSKWWLGILMSFVKYEDIFALIQSKFFVAKFQVSLFRQKCLFIFLLLGRQFRHSYNKSHSLFRFALNCQQKHKQTRIEMKIYFRGNVWKCRQLRTSFRTFPIDDDDENICKLKLFPARKLVGIESFLPFTRRKLIRSWSWLVDCWRHTLITKNSCDSRKNFCNLKTCRGHHRQHKALFTPILPLI